MIDVCALKELFVEAYPDGGEPGLCRAPGRVNIIGEHTDYNGLPVLPMTIDRDIGIAFAPRRDGRVRMKDTDGTFPRCEFANGASIPVSAPGAWENYCKAALTGLNEHFKTTGFPGMDMLVSGDIPIAAGLSSSSALVVACALAYLRGLEKELETDISRLELATRLAESEHYVGTRGGGMDQAIILLGGENEACKIDFFPLRTERVPLPEDHTLVVCNSLVKANKTGETLHAYNAGPRTSRLICALVARRVKEEFGEEVLIERLGDLWLNHLCLTHVEVEELFEKTFPRDRTTLEEAAQALRMRPEKIRGRWLGDLEEPAQGFALRARARHQRTEYQRVEAARDALVAGDAATLGRLMNASHESCATDYAGSGRELDALVAAARDSGAIGARLTGAGFGGCTVNLVPAACLEEFRAGVDRRYYREFLGRADGAPENAVFAARASRAAGYC